MHEGGGRTITPSATMIADGPGVTSRAA